MSEPNSNEIWQVDVGGTIYDAAFSELPEWIEGGSLLPADKVRKGNLRWIEARRVPSLIPFFNAIEEGEPMPVVVTTSHAVEREAAITARSVEGTTADVPDDGILEIAAVSPAVGTAFDPNKCALHADVDAFFLCEGCANSFCKACPNSYGGTVRICPLCGAMCHPAAEVKASTQKLLQPSFVVGQPFGTADFFNALVHPFNFKTSLFVGAFLFMIFTLGRGAGAMGGIFMIVGGIFSGMSANALTFGVLSNTIDKFIQGKFDENFMPDFDDFELWENVIHPFFLSIAAYVSSFGPFLLTLAIGFYLVTSAVNSRIDSYKSDLERIPGTPVYNGRELVDQSGDVKKVLQGIDEKQRERIAGMDTLGDGETAAEPTPFVDEESRKQEALWAEVTESRKQTLESALGKTAETRAQEDAETIKAFLGLAAPLVVLGFITFVWGLIFFPAACAVAGYSKSFLATINPLVGLDTMRRLGVDYLKILAMGFLLLVALLIVSGVLGAIFSAFDLPMVGNLPATALAALFTFYLAAVFSCILGYALYKRADRLGLLR
jgi:hypothetical protein